MHKHSSDIYCVCKMLRKNSVMAESIDSRIRLPGFKYQLYCLLALWLGQITFLSLSFFFCKMGRIVLLTTSFAVRIECNDTH